MVESKFQAISGFRFGLPTIPVPRELDVVDASFGSGIDSTLIGDMSSYSGRLNVRAMANRKFIRSLGWMLRLAEGRKLVYRFSASIGTSTLGPVCRLFFST